MKNQEISNFEFQQRQLLDGFMDVPIFVGVDHDREDLPDILFNAAKIVVSAKIKEGLDGIEELVDQIGAMLTEPKIKKGIILEDEDGYGAIKIKSDVTLISIRGQGINELPTNLFFDMIYFWKSNISL
ncbi:hypothetical protein KDA11_02185 [Candidatus Saccharibacteria bacterium]|nr:hypothetical protein [Candidatus Saccharibacteria bacterium]